MYLFLPLVNKGITSVTKNELIIINLSLFGILFIWKDLTQDESELRKNNVIWEKSVITLLSFYILGAYIGKFVINKHQNRNIFYYIFYYIILISLFVSASYTTYYLRFNNITISNKALILLKKVFHNSCNSIPMVLETISLTLIFTKIKYNKFISKIITYIGPLTFSVYLIHSHWDVRINIYKGMFEKYSSALSFLEILLIILGKSIKIFCISILIDSFRNLIFKIFRIKNMCMLVEKIIDDKFKKIFKE